MYNIRKNKKGVRTAAAVMAAVLLCGCASGAQTGDGDGLPEQGAEAADENGSASISGRPMFLDIDINAVESDAENNGMPAGITPCVASYEIAQDLSNIDNLWQFYLQDEMVEKIAQNGFVVRGDAGKEFFEIYERNRYDMIPNFVTVDSMMHTYHLYFAHLLKNIEKEHLTGQIAQLSSRMLAQSMAQYETLQGSEWESAALRNIAFFAVGEALSRGDTTVGRMPKEAADMAGYELSHIEQAAGVAESAITTTDAVKFEDYSQYIPRGYYEGDEALERYFKTMMWYGRIHFSQEEEDMNRSAFLMTKALADDAESYKLWESIYAVTSFFAGASDDMGVCEYAPLMEEVYGEQVTVEDLTKNETDFVEFCKLASALPAPQINSIPIWDGEENVIPGFRFMGQRFTIDASIMQKLIYSDVKENSMGEKRMLPDVLDVPAALGSGAALEILKSAGAMEFAGYAENMEKLQKGLSKENETLWTASLYANWLNTLRPLLTVKGEGYPVFMQNEEWVKKDLECFAGSFTELKHDTILYSKQVIAQMGGGWEEEPDDRGYVEPEPLVYARFARLTDLTAQGLGKYGMLDEADEENLTRLSQLAKQLEEISIKELQDVVLTDEEYEFIKTYGGSIEHFWYEAVKEETDSEFITSHEYPAAVVVDIATDPNGQVLEAATDNPGELFVVIKVDGKIKLARGSVYSFYQFAVPLEDRMTDSEWRRMMGIERDDDGNYDYDSRIEKPEWTDSYWYHYEWE